MISTQAIMQVLAVSICFIKVASAASCGKTMINANFNRFGDNFMKWTRDGVAAEFPFGLRYCSTRIASQHAPSR
jgi:hypothetical protein